MTETKHSSGPLWGGPGHELQLLVVADCTTMEIGPDGKAVRVWVDQSGNGNPLRKVVGGRLSPRPDGED